jgi:hypothetical protein
LLGLGLGQLGLLGGLAALDFGREPDLLGHECIKGGLGGGGVRFRCLGGRKSRLRLALERRHLGLDCIEVGAGGIPIGLGRGEVVERLVGERCHRVGEHQAGGEIVGARRAQRHRQLPDRAPLEQVGGERVQRALGLVASGDVAVELLLSAGGIGLGHGERGPHFGVVSRRSDGIGLGEREPVAGRRHQRLGLGQGEVCRSELR